MELHALESHAGLLCRQSARQRRGAGPPLKPRYKQLRAPDDRELLDDVIDVRNSPGH